MIKHPKFVSAMLCISASLIVAGNSTAEEAYDEDTYGPESSIGWTIPVKATFDHKIHTMDAGLECSSCHDDLFAMQIGTAEESNNFTMRAMAEGEYCGACHDGNTAFATDTNCMACHNPSAEPIIWDKPTKASFSHNTHVEDLGLDCSSCHSTIFAMNMGEAEASGNFTMSSFKEGRYCGSCHNGDDAFDAASRCEACHFPPAEKIVFDKPVKSVVFEHKIHVERAGLSCESCHKEVFEMEQGHVADSTLASSDDPAVKRKYLEDLHSRYCGSCHDSNKAFGYLTRCTVCHIGVKGYDQMNGGQDTHGEHGNSNH